MGDDPCFCNLLHDITLPPFAETYCSTTFPARPGCVPQGFPVSKATSSHGASIVVSAEVSVRLNPLIWSGERAKKQQQGYSSARSPDGWRPIARCDHQRTG